VNEPLEYLSQHLVHLSDRQLLRIATVDQDHYEPAAIVLVREELHRRGLDNASLETHEEVRRTPLVRQVSSLRDYGGLWKRLLARGIDFLVLLPFGAINAWSWCQSSNLAIASSMIYGLITPMYLVASHVACGQSVGKMVLGLRVERTTGTPLSWWRACVRFSPVFAMEIAWGIGTALAFRSIPEATLFSVPYSTRVRLVVRSYPEWVQRTANLYTLWLALDSLVLAASSRKRSIHDFMAGTVVKYSVNKPDLKAG
jgi:uncharacterized RDD family membrane protein YckC